MRWWMAMLALGACGRPGEIQVEVDLGDTEAADTDCVLEARISGAEEVTAPDQVCVHGACECADGPTSLIWSLGPPPCWSELSASDLWEEDGSLCFVPDTGGPYRLSLHCTDGTSTSRAATFEVTVLPWDGPPGLTCECPERGRVGEPVPLSAILDCDERPYSWFWELQSKPQGSMASNDDFDDRASRDTTFTGDIAGEYLVSVSGFDGSTWSAPSLCTFVLE